MAIEIDLDCPLPVACVRLVHREAAAAPLPSGYDRLLSGGTHLTREAKDHIGENASVRGLIEQVSFSQKGHAFLNFGGRYPRQVFTGFVPAQSVAAAGGHKFLESLSGTPVTVTGKIELYKGRPEIVISSSAQIVR